MFLRDIEVRVEERLEGEFSVAQEARPMENLFLRKLKKVNTTPYSKINIYLTNANSISIKGLVIDVLDCFIYFDYKHFSSLLDKYDRKKQVLDSILTATLNCAEVKGWSRDPFLDAYNECLKDKLKNEWWFKRKLFQSPNKNFYAGLLHIFDTEGFFIELVLFDKNKKQIIKRIIFKDKYLSFELDWAKWRDDSNSFLLKFKPPKKVFEYKVDDLLYNRIMLPEKISDFFK